jgi:probable rRNA maturation factor
VTLDLRAFKARVARVLELLCDNDSSVNIRLCGLEEMRAANASFRGKDYATDVLSFPAVPGFSDTRWRGRLLYSVGDLLVCLPVCHKQARERRVDVSRELEMLVIHGLVHLKGLDHERSEAAWRVMSGLEKALAKELTSALGEPSYLNIGTRD